MELVTVLSVFRKNQTEWVVFAISPSVYQKPFYTKAQL